MQPKRDERLGTARVSHQSPVDRRELLELLCVDMTETARAQKLGVARSSYYAQLDKLIAEGILISRIGTPAEITCTGTNPRFRFSESHYASVLKATWVDEMGTWGVQGALLDEWDARGARTVGDIAVVVRWVVWDSARVASFVVTVRGRAALRPEKEPKTRWSSRDTRRELPATWLPLPNGTIRLLTAAIARVIDGEAIILPEDMW